MSELRVPDVPGDFERRFGGLRRLYGVAGAQRIFDGHVVVVGVGGVGSWTAEALARSGGNQAKAAKMLGISPPALSRRLSRDEGE